MLKTRLPWLFLALAVASPPLWFWFVRWSVRDDYEGTGAGIGFFIVLPIVSLMSISLFVTLAALMWRPVSGGSRNLKRVTLLFFGGGSLLAGLVIFMSSALNAQDLGWELIGISVSVLFIGSGIMAGREFFLRLGSDDPGEDGERGGPTQFAGRHRR